MKQEHSWGGLGSVSSIAAGLILPAVFQLNVVSAQCPVPQPASITASDGSNCAAVLLNWSSVQFAVEYEVARETTQVQFPSNIITPDNYATTQFQDQPPIQGQDYFYYVRARRSLCTSPSNWTGPEPGWRRAVPESASGLGASDATRCDGVLVQWTPAGDATNYRVYRGTSFNCAATTGFLGSTNTNSFLDTTAVAGQSYQYWVRAENPCGLSASCSNSNPGSRANTPSPPSQVNATAGDHCTHIHVSWSPSNGATGYEVWRSTSSSSPSFLAAVGGTSHDELTTLPGNNYCYWIKSKNATCTSLLSTDNDCGFRGFTPSPPMGVSATNGSDCANIRVTWTASVGASSYEVWRGLQGGPIVELRGTTSASPFFDNPEEPALQYVYAVKAVSNCGTSALGGGDVGFVGSPPAAPTNVSASDGTDCRHVRIMWNQTPAPIPALTHFEVLRNSVNSPISAQVIGSPTATLFDDSTASAGATNYYWVRSYNGCGPSGTSASDTGFRSSPDADLDGRIDCEDNCLHVANNDQSDVDSDGVGDACDNCPDDPNPDQADCDDDGVGDRCMILDGMDSDCNANLIPDACDIASGASDDCQLDGIPDDCQLLGDDCDGNGIPDDCQIAAGAADCQNDDVPDLCQLSGNDCNVNQVPDDCDIRDGVSDDCTANGIPDECESEWSGPPGLFALGLDGATAYMPLPDSPELDIAGDVTLEAWIRPAAQALSGSHMILGRVEGNKRAFLGIRSGDYEVGALQPASRIASFQVPQGDVGQWVHLAGTYSSVDDQWVLYRNGLAVAQRSNDSAGAPALGTVWHVGAANGTTEFFPGGIDEVRIWDVARSSPEISGNFQIAIQTPLTSLIANLRLEEGEGDELRDSAQAETFIYLVGGASWLSIEGACFGDFDSDGDVDWQDTKRFIECFSSGPNTPPLPLSGATAAHCLAAFDYHGDGDVDIGDFAIWQQRFGP